MGVSMKTCFYTIVDDKYYYQVGTHKMINSFKRFHPDIDLVVFRQDMIDYIFNKHGLNFYNCKPTFAKLLTDQYDRIINIDADYVITGRMTEILDTDWEVGGAWNYNDYENTSVENVDEKMFIQAGMVGSTKKEFWDVWERENKKAMKYKCKENDILSLIWYNDPVVSKMKRLIWDKDKGYLGCKSLGREKEMEMDGDKLMLRGEEVKAYHHAKGAVFPKLDFDKMPFRLEVKEYLKFITIFGKSMRLSTI